MKLTKQKKKKIIKEEILKEGIGNTSGIVINKIRNEPGEDEQIARVHQHARELDGIPVLEVPFHPGLRDPDYDIRIAAFHEIAALFDVFSEKSDD